ncbi:MAG: hypothetical protein QOE02_5644, partial [Rhodospirillaceae bacterium]|nr:hypothetical protein [Rhodospirillaceae bacterium]
RKNEIRDSACEQTAPGTGQDIAIGDRGSDLEGAFRDEDPITCWAIQAGVAINSTATAIVDSDLIKFSICMSGRLRGAGTTTPRTSALRGFQ